MALYPLCRHGRRPRAAITYAAGVIQEGVPDTIVRADLLATLYIFGKLVYPGLDLLRLIGREQMKVSRAFREIMDEGRKEAQREHILTVLSSRFGPESSAEFAAPLNVLDDVEVLSRLFELSLNCSELEEFRHVLEEQTQSEPAGRRVRKRSR
jgi:hypothetical protein